MNEESSKLIEKLDATQNECSQLTTRLNISNQEIEKLKLELMQNKKNHQNDMKNCYKLIISMILFIC